MKIYFDVEQLYYLPQYLPVYHRLRERGAECLFVCRAADEWREAARQAMASEGLPVIFILPEEGETFYRGRQSDWIVFGNGCGFLDKLPAGTRTALLYHGIGMKACYYEPALARMDVRFVEGEFRLRELRKAYPEANFVLTGFAKLDPLFAPERREGRERKTVLYAPTFYPSSIEMLPDRWPEELPGCDLVVKPHFFTLADGKYASQRRKLERWSRYPHVRVAGMEEYSLLPSMREADILVTEASSALFEFAALDRPVVWLDFFRLRWSYRGPLRYRFNRRMDTTILRYADIGAHAASPRETSRTILAELESPQRYSVKRREYTRELIGETDGNAAARIADYLLGAPVP